MTGVLVSPAPFRLPDTRAPAQGRPLPSRRQLYGMAADRPTGTLFVTDAFDGGLEIVPLAYQRG